MEELEVHMPFDFGGKTFFMVKGTIVDLQHILQKLNLAKNGQCTSILLNNVLHKIEFGCILVKSPKRNYNIQLDDAIRKIEEVLNANP